MTVPEPTPDQVVADRLKALLEADAGRLDAVTAARLQAARRRAVAAIDRPRRQTGWLARASHASGSRSYLLPAGGLVTAALAVLVLVMWYGHGVQPVPDVPVDDWEILADGELELLEDLDFYDWLADADTTG